MNLIRVIKSLNSLHFEGGRMDKVEGKAHPFLSILLPESRIKQIIPN